MPFVYYGIDIGDGETAVAFTVEGSHVEPQVMEIRGRKNMLTVLGEGASGARYIGEEAFQVGNVDSVFLRFKSRYRQEESARLHLEQFAALLLQSLREGHGLSEPSQSKVFVGCPSGWDAPTRAQYKQSMERAGFENVTIVSESRAALVYARESGELRVPGELLHRPTLIIDAGSSTTDFTYVEDMEERQLRDAGDVALGAGILDRLLLEYALSQRDDEEALYELFARYPALYARCELEARKVKEMYFVNQRRGSVQTYLNESSVKLHTDPPRRIDFFCDDRIMNRLLRQKVEALGGVSFLDAYEGALRGIAGRMAKPPETILMTGGASRMRFMQEIAAKVFPGAAVVQGNEPEFAIARGLCYALRMEERRAGFLQDVEALIRSEAVETVVMEQLEPLFRELSPLLVGAMADDLAPDVFSRWQDGQIKTLNDMLRTMAVEGGELMKREAMKERLRPAIARWLNALRPRLEQLTNPICDRYGLPRTSLKLPDFSPIATISAVDPSAMVDFTSVKVVVDIAVAAILATVAGGTGTALVLSGPLGWLAGFVVGLLAAGLGMELAERLVMSMDIPRAMRRLFGKRFFLGRLKEKKKEMETQLERRFAQKVQESAPEVREMADHIAKAIEQQLHGEMEKAILLIR